MQIHEVLTTPRSPWENAYVERVIGSIRRECLGHVIVLSVAWLQRVLANYVAYYMNTRAETESFETRGRRYSGTALLAMNWSSVVAGGPM